MYTLLSKEIIRSTDIILKIAVLVFSLFDRLNPDVKTGTH